jgi:hypothetical protein
VRGLVGCGVGGDVRVCEVFGDAVEDAVFAEVEVAG